MHRLLMTPVAALALLLVALSPAAAGEQGSTLDIQHRLCPTEYEGSDFANDCTEVSDTPIMFDLTGPTAVEGETDAEGNASFTGLAAGDYTIVGGVPGEFAENRVFCTADGENVAHEAGPGSLDVTIPESTTVTCLWYDIPLDLRGEPAPDTAMAPTSGASATPLVLALLGAVVAVTAIAPVVARRRRL